MANYFKGIQPINTPTLNNECYKKIKEMILEGQLPWGERVDVNLLASSFGVSKFPVIKALDRLAQEQLLTISPNRGTYVTTPTKEDFQEVTEVRIMVEKHAMKVGAAKNREALLNRLVAIHKRFGLADLPVENIDFQTFLSYDREFHTAIVESAENNRINNYYASIRSQAELFRTKTFSKKNITEAVVMHEEIINYLEKGDLDNALTALLKHLLQVDQDEKASLNATPSKA